MSQLEIIDCIQGSDEWWKARLAVVTASEFHCVLATGRSSGESKTRRKYMLRLVAEAITGEPQEAYSNAAMERGRAMEAEARDYYALLTDLEPVQVGFLRNGRVGCSPDSLIGNDGMHEIKCKEYHRHIECLLVNEVPTEHRAQCQGGLWVAEREWIDFQSYCPKLPPFIKRVHRDDKYIADLDKAVQIFLDELNELHEQIKRRYAA